MPAPLPVTTIEVAGREMDAAIVDLGHFLANDDERVVAWDAEIDKSFLKEPGFAHAGWAQLAQLRGDIEMVEHHVARSKKNGFDAQMVNHIAFMAYANLLYGTKGSALAQTHVDVKFQNIGKSIGTVASLGAFSRVNTLLVQAEAAAIDISHVKQIDTIKLMATEMSQAGVSDAEFAKVIDAAGDVMRQRRLFWLESQPRFGFDHGIGCAMIRHRVDVLPSEASSMNLELATILLDRRLEHVPLTVGFVGVKK